MTDLLTSLIFRYPLLNECQGEETEVPLSEILEISLYGDEAIYFGKHVINTGENVIKLLLDQQPTMARLDPYIKFIDRDIGNNTMLVNKQ